MMLRFVLPVTVLLLLGVIALAAVGAVKGKKPLLIAAAALLAALAAGWALLLRFITSM